MQPQVERIAVSELIPYANNSRTHSDEQVAKIAASLREFGWTNPVLITKDNGIIAGHGRVLAARKLGLHDVPCLRLAHLTPTQVRAYVIADNRLALDAGWDEELLKLELEALRDEGFDLDITGFEEDEIADLLIDGTTGLTDENEVPATPEVAVSKLGDVWVLDGRHRIVCGDSCDKDTVARLLAGVKPHLMVTDPPYGVKYDPKWRNEAGVSNSERTGVVLNDDIADWTDAWRLFPGDVAYIWHAALHSSTVATSMTATGFTLRAQIIWAKPALVMGRGDYHWQHEPCWYAVRKGATGHWAGDRKQTTLWSISAKGQDCETIHGTQKPVECMLRPMLNNSSPGQAVYEPFSGSGTTIIAAEKSGRICYAVELNPPYVDVAVERWQRFTGKVAVHESTGRSFDETKSGRPGRQAA